MNAQQHLLLSSKLFVPAANKYAAIRLLYLPDAGPPFRKIDRLALIPR